MNCSYEEKSLGVFEPPVEDEDEEPNVDSTKPRYARIGKYVGWHLRRQVAFDIWWLVWGIFLICIIERTKIMDDENAPWFNLFRISVSCLLLFLLSLMSASSANPKSLTISIRVGLRIRRYRSQPRYSNAKLLLFWGLWTTVQAYRHGHHGQRTPPWLARRHRQSQ